tara:strand:+ start:59 stop:217 length:159 start_codon:yes stop_codon:yes gene_type:complete
MNKALFDWLDKVEGKKYSTYERICKEKDKENFDKKYYESFEWFWNKDKKEKK